MPVETRLRQRLAPLAAICVLLLTAACSTTTQSVIMPGAEELEPSLTAKLLCNGNCSLLVRLEDREKLSGEPLWDSQGVVLVPGGYNLSVLWKPKGYFGGDAYTTDFGSFWIEAGETFVVKRCDYEERSDKDSSSFLAYRVFWIENADSGEVIRDWPGHGTSAGCRA